MATMVVLAGCASKPPEQIIAGALGQVAMRPPVVGSYEEGNSAEWARFVMNTALNRFYTRDGIARGQMLSRSAIQAELRRFLKARTAALWIGHSTFLIRAGGRTILTDPVFRNTTTPLEPLGPRRYFPPAMTIDELPPIDAIIVSHNHYDHLSALSLNDLAQRFPKAALLLPQGNEIYGRQAGFRDISGLQPGEKATASGITFTALPAYHATSRLGIDAGNTLALGWSIRPARGASIFFAGDTAFGPLFARIRKTYGRHDIALVPIGAYEPYEEIKHVHANPEDAAKIARDVGARLAIAMHWGTFPLSNEPYQEPVHRFLKAGGPPKRVLRIGETLILDRYNRQRLARH